MRQHGNHIEGKHADRKLREAGYKKRLVSEFGHAGEPTYDLITPDGQVEASGVAASDWTKIGRTHQNKS